MYTLIDNLSQKLNESKKGCMINDIFCNNLAYADDMAILAPAASGLQKQMNMILYLTVTNHGVCALCQNVQKL